MEAIVGVIALIGFAIGFAFLLKWYITADIKKSHEADLKMDKDWISSKGRPAKDLEGLNRREPPVLPQDETVKLLRRIDESTRATHFWTRVAGIPVLIGFIFYCLIAMAECSK